MSIAFCSTLFPENKQLSEICSWEVSGTDVNLLQTTHEIHIVSAQSIQNSATPSLSVSVPAKWRGIIMQTGIQNKDYKTVCHQINNPEN
uniref:Uncharacterized protein n=1 Tax=Anguilla anguilla TaxID=7936 RepID=A0A0E9WWL1_ANGAN